MSYIVDFKPKASIDSTQQLKALINWAQETLPKGIPTRVHEGIEWNLKSWTSSGIKGASFTALGSSRNGGEKDKRYMVPDFMQFAKSVVVYRFIFQGKGVSDSINALKALEVALQELTSTSDVTQMSAAVCNRACELAGAHWKVNNAYITSKALERIIAFMTTKSLIAKPFRWISPLKKTPVGTLNQQRQDTNKKLPSKESILALGELFNNNVNTPLDIVVTSACALLLSQPARVGELADVELECILYKEGENGSKRMFLRWYGEKGFGATTKPVMTGMEPVVKRAIEKILPITNNARDYAAWLEDHPDEFPVHDELPDKGLDDALSYTEACAAIKLSAKVGHSRSRFKCLFIDPLIKHKALSPIAKVILSEINNGWDTSKGKRIFVKGGGAGVKRIEYDDKAVITLRKLNILIREKYLPKTFPYTTAYEAGKKRVKFRDALFTVRTSALVGDNVIIKKADFGIEIAANPKRLSANLGTGGSTKNIFERHGYNGVRVNTHAFRHELNTQMHRANMSQLLIDAFSGRTSMGSVYNHETVEERTQAVAVVHPKTKQSKAEKRLEKIKTNEPISLTDVTDLAEDSQDRILHQMDFGICVHNWAGDPCPKMGACLGCGKLACVKGDDVKLQNIKAERDYLKARYHKATEAQSRGEFGANEWVKKVGQDLLKCDALIKLLEDPDLENGDIVWNADNGWNLTNNAAAMAGLIEPELIEAQNQVSLPSLDELEAMLDKIEV